MSVEKHRTLFFADSMDHSRQMLGRCVRLPTPMKVGDQELDVAPILYDPNYDAEGEEGGGYRIVPSVGRGVSPVVWDGKAGYPWSGEAMVFPDFEKTHTMVTWRGQNFGVHATAWEALHSPIVAMSPRPKPTPVVDTCGIVIGYHLRKVSSGYLFATDDGAIFYMSSQLSDPAYREQAHSIAGDKIFFTPADEPVYATGVIGGYKAWMKLEKWVDLLVDIDGHVLVVNTYSEQRTSVVQRINDAVDSIPLLGWVLPRLPDPNIPDKCFGEFDEDMIGYDECAAKMTSFHADSLMLLADLISLGASKAARRLITTMTKAATQGVKRASMATALTLALRLGVPQVTYRPVIKAAIKRIALPDGRLAEQIGIRVVKGYDDAMGIPKDHFMKMAQAAKEANGIAVFRANKKAAIELIEKLKAHPKPKHYNAFKTSKETGVLTAKLPADIETAYKHGDFVVGDDLVPRRTTIVNGKPVTVELKLNKPAWKVEKGQVIRPDGKPIVGDYDLLGFLPNESPGRNMTVVPKDHVIDDVKGDWTGPDVQRYQKAVNAKFDQPRVLHGAQDGFQHSKFGGLTDDVAYAVYGNGQAVILDGRAAQEAFYAAYRRQHALGQHPRPAPGTPVVDDLAKRRAQKQGGRK